MAPYKDPAEEAVELCRAIVYKASKMREGYGLGYQMWIGEITRARAIVERYEKEKAWEELVKFLPR